MDHRKLKKVTDSESKSDSYEGPDYVEAEVDSTDQLIPTMTEPFGQNLLAQRYLDEEFAGTVIGGQLQQLTDSGFISAEADEDSVPGVVPGTAPPRRRMPPTSNTAASGHPVSGQAPFFSPQLHQKTSATSTITARRPRPRNTNASMYPQNNVVQNERKRDSIFTSSRNTNFDFSDQRTGTMMSHATFIVENNSRKPLLAPSGFENAVALVAEKLQNDSDWHKLLSKKSPNGNGTTNTNEMMIIEETETSVKDNTSTRNRGQNNNKSFESKPTKESENINKNTTSVNIRQHIPQTADRKLLQFKRQKSLTVTATERRAKSPLKPVIHDENDERIANEFKGQIANENHEKNPSTEISAEIEDDYRNVFGSRPKVARTPPQAEPDSKKNENTEEKERYQYYNHNPLLFNGTF